MTTNLENALLHLDAARAAEQNAHNLRIEATLDAVRLQILDVFPTATLARFNRRSAGTGWRLDSVLHGNVSLIFPDNVDSDSTRHVQSKVNEWLYDFPLRGAGLVEPIGGKAELDLRG